MPAVSRIDEIFKRRSFSYQLATVYILPAEAIKNFDEEAAMNYISTFNDNSVSHVIGNHGTYNFDPIEKWVEALEENKKLYERLLKEKDEKIGLLEKLSKK